MPKKNNTNRNIVIGLVILVVIYLASTGRIPSFSVSPIQGFYTLSVSKVSINGQNQLIFTTSQGGNQNGAITLSGAAADALKAIGKNPNNITISSELSSQTCRYGIDYQNELLLSPSSVDGGATASFSGYTYGGNTWGVNFVENPTLQKGYINGQKFAPIWSVKITMTFEDGTKIEKIVDNDNAIADFGAIGNVAYVGGLASQASCGGAPPNAVLIRELNSQNWKQAQISDFNTYTSAYSRYSYAQSGATNCPSGEGNSIAASQALCQPLQNKLAAAASVNGALAALRANAVGDFAGYYTFDPQANIINPELVWTLNVDQIAIEAPKLAAAQLVSFSSNAVTETSNADVQAVIKNIGTQQDNFDVGLINCNPTGLTLNPIRVTLAVGEQKTVDLVVNGAANTYSCTLSAVPIGNPTDGAASSPLNIQISKRTCPSTFACCSALPNYLDRGCVDTSSVKTRVDTITGQQGYALNTTYVSYVEIQHYSCSQYTCNPSSTEVLAGSEIVTTGNPATPSVTYQAPSPSTEATPTGQATTFPNGATPTPMPYTGGNLGGLNINPEVLAVILVIIGGVVLFRDKIFGKKSKGR